MSKKFAALMLTAAMAFGGAAQAAGFSGGSSANVASVLTADGVTAVTKTEGKKPYVAATLKDGTKFVVEFYHCDANKLNCGIAIWTANWTSTVTSEQLNRWNRWTFTCPSYAMDDDKSTAVWMGINVAPSDNAQSVELQFKAFNHCLDQFQEFLTDPEAFLKANE
jgi:hypothetical protein